MTDSSFYAMTSVFVREDGRWTEAFENGDEWPLDPTERRPDGPPFVLVTSTSGAGVRNGVRVTFTAGVVSTAVARLNLASALDQHDLAVDRETGIFVALALQPDDGAAFQLVAFDGDGGELDRIEYVDPWSG